MAPWEPYASDQVPDTHPWACLVTGGQDMLAHAMVEGMHGGRRFAVLHWGCLRCTYQDGGLSELVCHPGFLYWTCIPSQEFSHLTYMKRKRMKFSHCRVNRATRMPQNHWDAGSHGSSATSKESWACDNKYKPLNVLPCFICHQNKSSLQPDVTLSTSPSLPPSQAQDAHSSPLIPQHSTRFPYSPLLHYVLILLPINIHVWHSLCSCATLSECHYSFWHSQINILEVLLWLKCIYSQRLLFFLSWLWGFASGTTYIDAGVALVGLLLRSPKASRYEAAHDLLNYSAC